LLAEPAQLQALVDVLLTARTIGYDVTIFFLSLGTIVFCGLLYRSRYVPRVLAGLGIVSFVLLPAAAIVSLLLPPNTRTSQWPGGHLPSCSRW
jgi:Domain of unknown function (DUF4386)